MMAKPRQDRQEPAMQSAVDGSAEARLDLALAALREDLPDDAALEAATQRSRQRLNEELIMNEQQTAIDGCQGYQALIPDYLAGELPAARKLLFKDHSRSCVECRRALNLARAEARGIVVTQRPERAARRRLLPARYAMAAALTLVAGLTALAGWQILGPARVMASVQSADGGLYRIEGAESLALVEGDRLEAGQTLRTGRMDGSIITLSDGSRVEIAPRSEFKLSRRGRDTSIDVSRGDIIVEASDQGSGHLYVNTRDCLVSVTGTVFSVKQGTRGSRVSVVEGQVRVKQGSQEQVLAPGDQIATDPGLGTVPFEDEFAWSRFSDEHLALLHKELAGLGAELDALPKPDARFASDLAGELPADTAIFIALPNLSSTLGQASGLIRDRVAQSEVLGQWWSAKMQGSDAEADLLDLLDRLAAVGAEVGDEVLISVGVDDTGDPSVPLVMGPIEDPIAFREALTREVSALARDAGEPLPLRFVDDLDAYRVEVEAIQAANASAAVESGEGAEAAAEVGQTYETGADELVVWVGADRFAMTPDPAALLRLTEGARLAGSDFHAAIERSYAEGVDWLFAVDMSRMVDRALAGTADDPEASASIRGLGVEGARFLVVRQVEVDGRTDTRAELSFAEGRKGMAGWLAEPAPMGALDFIAPDAHVAAAFVTRAPAEIFDELMGIFGSMGGSAREDFEAAQTEIGLDLRESLAAPLGGEFAFALDGPLLPEPAWKLVVEVYDPARLQASLEEMVAKVNEHRAVDGAPAGSDLVDGAASAEAELADAPITLSSETRRGVTWYSLGLGDKDFAIHYRYVDGYLVAGSSQAIVERALQYRSSGVNLRTAPSFDALLLPDEEMNVSALMYQNLAPIAAPVGDFLADKAGSVDGLPADQAAILGSAAAGADIPATLAYVYALPDRIVLSGRSDGGPLGMGLGALLGLDRALGLGGMD